MSSSAPRVLLDGLSKKALNGRGALMLGVDEATGRYMVQLERDKPPIKVKPENVVKADDFDRVAAMAMANGALTEARLDNLTDEVAQGVRSGDELLAHLLNAAAELHFDPGSISALTRTQEALIRQKPPGEYVICNVVSRPELNGLTCSVTSGTFGQFVTPVNAARVQRTGEVIRLHNDKLTPLAKAPATLMYDEADLALEEHAIPADSNLVSVLSIPNPKRDVSFAVRVHGLASAAGRALNGRQGVAFCDRGDGRLGVRFGEGDTRAVRVTNLLLARDVVSLTAGCAASEGPHEYNAASRTAGNFDETDEPRRGFLVHLPPLPTYAVEYGGAGWPGVYTDRRLRGIADANPAHVLEADSWRAACERWEEHRERVHKAHCPYVLMLSTPVDEETTADELASCMRWFLAATALGRELASNDGVGVIGAHVEPPSVFATDLDTTPPSMGHLALSLSSIDTRHSVYDVLGNLVDKPTFSLRIRARALALRLYDFDEARRRRVNDDDDDDESAVDGGVAPAGRAAQPVRKRRQDDWVELKSCDNAPFRFESWVLHRHPSAASGGGGLGELSLLNSKWGHTSVDSNNRAVE